MAEVCECVLSNRDNIKLVIKNYILTKNKNKDDIYYWRCERRYSMRCYGSASTILINGQHYLQRTTEHSHTPEAFRKYLIPIIKNLRRKARETSDSPSQILLVEFSVLSTSSLQSLPSYQALRHVIMRKRKKLK